MHNLYKNFLNAFAGLWHALAHERIFRLQWLLGVMVFLVSSLLAFEAWQQSIVILLVFLVLALELHNSALENACDSLGKTFDEHKKRAKDFAAASVLLFCMGAAVVFFCIAGPYGKDIWQLLLQKPYAVLSLSVIFFATVLPIITIGKSKNTAWLVAVALLGDVGFILTSHGDCLFICLGLIFHAFVIISFMKVTISQLRV